MMNIIVGLGNPDRQYFGTYHNIGFACVDALAQKLGITFDKEKYKASIGEGIYNGEKNHARETFDLYEFERRMCRAFERKI